MLITDHIPEYIAGAGIQFTIYGEFSDWVEGSFEITCCCI